MTLLMMIQRGSSCRSMRIRGSGSSMYWIAPHEIKNVAFARRTHVVSER